MSLVVAGLLSIIFVVPWKRSIADEVRKIYAKTPLCPSKVSDAAKEIRRSHVCIWFVLYKRLVCHESWLPVLNPGAGSSPVIGSSGPWLSHCRGILLVAVPSAAESTAESTISHTHAYTTMLLCEHAW